MAESQSSRRTDSGSRIIGATPAAIYRACIDPTSVAAWRPPTGMSAEVYTFEPHEGGTFRMAFIYQGEGDAGRGKTSERADVFEGRFMELVPNARIVEAVEFESADAAFAGVMTVTTTLEPVPGGTEVTMSCSDVPAGISEADHLAGIASSLANLAAYVE